jgi:hypothetical protein
LFSSLKPRIILLVFVCFGLFCANVVAETPSEQAAKLLPASIGDFHAKGSVGTLGSAESGPTPKEGYESLLFLAYRQYVSLKGGAISIRAFQTTGDSAAYAVLTQARATLSTSPQVTPGVGTLAYQSGNRLMFFKGPVFVELTSSENGPDNETLTRVAGQLAQSLTSDNNDIPALVKHLPDWMRVEENAIYAISLPALKETIKDQPILDAVDFSGGVEAVVAPYNNASLAIVEFTTPQLATTNDAKIQARLEELRKSGQPVPSAYQRVGNYAVFVFNAPDAQTAENLIKGVSYEQVVQWLGNNPNILRRAQRAYAATTAGIVIAVVKASGYSLLICLGIGGLFGTYVFRKRRARMAKAETYSDSGGMVRLGIDDLNVAPDATRLLGPGER